MGINLISKFKNKKIYVDGIKFDSKRESERYKTLKLLSEAGKISQLKLQPIYVLQDGFVFNKEKIRAISYRADFEYIMDKKTIIEDSKGFRTNEYKIKRKMFLRLLAKENPEAIFMET